jgi:hypothetical protein
MYQSHIKYAVFLGYKNILLLRLSLRLEIKINIAK